MLTARRVTCKCTVIGLVVCNLVGCSAKAYRTPDVGTPQKKDLATLVLPDLTNLKVFSIDGIEVRIRQDLLSPVRVRTVLVLPVRFGLNCSPGGIY